MRRPGLSIAAVALALLLAVPAAAAPVERHEPLSEAPGTAPAAYSPNGVIVQWAPGADRGDRRAARDEAEVTYASDLGNREFQLLETEPGQAPAAAVAELEANPAVAVAERDGYRSLDSIPNDPLFGQLWALRNQGLGIAGFAGAVAGADIKAPAAWDRSVGSPSTVVADIDTGYRFEHPDLANVAWTNQAEATGVAGVDDDGNGVIDDVHGADFIGANGENPEIDGDPTDEDLISGGHGVHTAGTIGAEGDNGVGVTGVAQDVSIMPLRACSRFPNLEGNRCLISSVVAAINYAGAMGARVANMSLGGTNFFQTEVNAIAAAKDTLFVISAGNDGADNDGGGGAPAGHHSPCDYEPQAQASPPVPGAIDNVVCVAATDQADGLASFSDWGAQSVDLGAPGTEILSTYPFVTPLEDGFELNDFASKWTATGADGGFERTAEAPLTSFGMTDGVGPPVAETVRETTSAAIALAPNGGCKLSQTRRVVLGGTAHFRYSILLNGQEKSVFEPASTPGPGLERRFAELPAAFKAGGELQVRFRFTAGSAPPSESGAWIDDIVLVCSQAVGQASGYAFLQGTSMAAPQVSATAGLLFSLRPAANVEEVRGALLAGVDPTAALAGKTVTGGRLDAAGALESLDPSPPPPSAPSLSSTDPSSPANENHPRILGTAAAGTTVKIYLDPACAGPAVATGTAAELESPGIEVSVADNSISEFSATATDAAARTSACSAPISYTEQTPPPPDTEAPDPPSLATLPASPSIDPEPRIVGAAEAGSAIAVYGGASCEGAALAAGTAAELESPGFPVSVPSGTTAAFSATATDAALNVSTCATISYTAQKVLVITGGEVVTEQLRDQAPPAPTAGASIAPPVIPTCKVPRLSGKTLTQARAALSAAGCHPGTVVKPKPRKGRRAAALIVKATSPAAGSLAPGDVVGLTLGPKPKHRRH